MRDQVSSVKKDHCTEASDRRVGTTVMVRKDGARWKEGCVLFSREKGLRGDRDKERIWLPGRADRDAKGDSSEKTKRR